MATSTKTVKPEQVQALQARIAAFTAADATGTAPTTYHR